ncbi:RagB/SusD family nutrient uptake outer membrane protein [Sphingobacterium paucimobilis]|uniref:Carbohydrate-binding protein SusD n=1 Tax=Sphingobacterium paucimobilis HER1398 TaxID=1346330 RepID=U2HQ17_9SPHI|nr:RagB/SusD family nutrient uptake outer membrane protein [Sphingobacterium paucimobilis]ERJ57390.1 hypothetical protein M472_01285 [Sphingobacterium paucimobilis HER1398]
MKAKYIIVYLVSIFLGTTSCSKSFLKEETDPNYLTLTNFWKTEGDIIKGLTSAYSHLQPNMSWGTPFERHIVVDNYRSDELDFRADVTAWLQVATFVNTSTNSISKSEWTLLYRGINYANQCIDNIPKVVSAADDFRARAIAEARFLRAYYYYRLYLNYGENIPLYTKEIKGTDEEFFPKQAAPGEIIAFLVKELSEIQAILPEPGFYSAKDAGRINRYAASAILGKLYMFVHQLDKAETEFAKIIGKFELMDNYEHNFDGLHKNNKESIFEVQYSGDRTAGRREFNRIALHLASSNAEGYEEAYPSTWLFETLKKDKTLNGGYSDRLYSTIIFNDPKSDAFYFENGKSFLDYHRDGEIFWKKFVSWDPSLSEHWTQSAFNFPLVRYADVLLLYAECLNNRGATTTAIDLINTVRGRVNVIPIASSLTKEQVLKHLQDIERPSELALEGGRWYDLIRWGITEEALKAHNKPYVANFVKSKHQLFPIPHDEFLLNPEWIQNPNFSK